VYLQAKRWDGPVGRPAVQAFAGSLEGFRANKGVMITTSRFSDDAQQYVRNIQKKIVLIDGSQLVQYMIEYGLGAVETEKYSIMRVALDDLDYGDDVAGVPVPLVGSASVIE
jgi:restriction system protein